MMSPGYMFDVGKLIVPMEEKMHWSVNFRFGLLIIKSPEQIGSFTFIG